MKLTLLLSILTNILFLVIGGIAIKKKGGLSYLLNKFYSLVSIRSKLNLMYNNPFYQDKTSHFQTLPKSEAEIIFLGDSLTDLCEWAEFLENSLVKNRGICGDTTDGILNRIENIIQSQPQKIFLLIGINDLNQGRQVTDIAKNYSLILREFNDALPHTKLFVQSVLPVNYQKFQKTGVNEKIIALNTQLQELAKEFSCHYIDLFSAFLDKNNELDSQYTTDGVHLNGQGYLVWKRIIEQDVAREASFK